MQRRGFDRRTFLTLAATGAGAAAGLFGTEFWRGQHAFATLTSGTGPYGPLQAADANGLQLPIGFAGRELARTGQAVNGGYVWHSAPDGGACFPRQGGGWSYVSNSEVGGGGGGASALRFDAGGAVVAGYRILSGTSRNCAGGATPWGTWLSCEENGDGSLVFECDPHQSGNGVARAGLGSFNHEAAAVDPTTGTVYLTEDHPTGRLYRFRPVAAGDLTAGTLEAAAVSGQQVTWLPVSITGPDRQPATAAFNGGEGAVVRAGSLFFTTKGDNRVWELELAASRLTVLYDDNTTANAPLTGVDNITAHPVSGDLFVCEDGGNLEICLIGAVDGVATVAPFLRLNGQPGSELAGAAFSPDGTRLYFSSQRGVDATHGVTYEVTGPFRSIATPAPLPPQGPRPPLPDREPWSRSRRQDRPTAR